MNKLIIILLLFTFVTGHATGYKHHLILPAVTTESNNCHGISKDIRTVFLKSRKIKAILTTKNDTRKSRSVRMNKEQKGAIRFILTNPKNYQTNSIVFGNFLPQFKLRFKHRRKIYISNFDFGLKKWNICDKSGKEIQHFDLRTDEMLRFATIVFPKDTYLNELSKHP